MSNSGCKHPLPLVKRGRGEETGGSSYLLFHLTCYSRPGSLSSANSPPSAVTPTLTPAPQLCHCPAAPLPSQAGLQALPKPLHPDSHCCSSPTSPHKARICIK